MPHDLPPDGVPRAERLAFSCCHCGAVTLELLDAAGRPIARALIPRDAYLALVSNIDHNLQQLGIIVAGPGTVN